MFNQIYGKKKVVSPYSNPGTICKNAKGEIFFLVKAFPNGEGNFFTGESGPKSFFKDDLRKYLIEPFAEKV